ncbi:hypothetical protein Hypma_008882 [Hypsizygus marmoreus]|uniref:Uncharacterized protein n=1 Tax=Hypsizygus marmoreus TaxID=39966 RepID=A0A151V5I2_HYPMA|nr:hypothetical protein Hypma_003612 [Hypsizygus marmoreus]RDB23557.1 hypothetical protein Hypma_008882 [Hypsizygus marmoreus]
MIPSDSAGKFRHVRRPETRLFTTCIGLPAAARERAAPVVKILCGGTHNEDQDEVLGSRSAGSRYWRRLQRLGAIIAGLVVGASWRLDLFSYGQMIANFPFWHPRRVDRTKTCCVDDM